MSGMSVVSLRVTEHEKKYLASVAEKYNLKKQGSDELSTTKALKFILSYCLHNRVDFDDKKEDELPDLRKMIEQIHASIPHVMYHQKFQSVILANKYSDDDLKQIQGGSLQYIDDTFAGFQSCKYNYISDKRNMFGLQTIPIEEGLSIWK